MVPMQHTSNNNEMIINYAIHTGQGTHAGTLYLILNFKLIHFFNDDLVSRPITYSVLQ